MDIHLDTVVERTQSTSQARNYNKLEWQMEAKIECSLKMHLEAVIEQVWGYP